MKTDLSYKLSEHSSRITDQLFLLSVISFLIGVNWWWKKNLPVERTSWFVYFHMYAWRSLHRVILWVNDALRSPGLHNNSHWIFFFLYLFDSFLSAWCKNKKEKLVTVSINVLFCPNPKYILFLSVEEWLKIFEFYQNICSLISCRSTVHSNSKFKELEFIELAAESLLVSPKIVFWWKVFGEFIFESNVSIFLD